MSKRLIIAFCCALVAGTVSSNPMMGGNGPLKSMASIPSDGIKILENQKGELVAASSNGRWVFKGKIIDMWNNETLTSMEDVRRSTEYINLDGMKLDINDLNPIEIGPRQAPTITAFVDPECQYCQQIMPQMEQLADRYRFRLLPIGILSKTSRQRTRELGCAIDKSQAAKALIHHDYSDLPQDSDCDLEPIQKTLITAKLMGLRGVPYLIAPNGKIQRGNPDDLEKWIEANNDE